MCSSRDVFLSWVLTARFSPDGKLIATAAADCSVRLWSVETARMIVKLEDITGLQLSPGADDALVVTVRPATTVAYASIVPQDDPVKSCRSCSKEFSFFGKHKHRCRFDADCAPLRDLVFTCSVVTLTLFSFCVWCCNPNFVFFICAVL